MLEKCAQCVLKPVITLKASFSCLIKINNLTLSQESVLALKLPL